ncbi:hypothetical protein Tco_0496521 [Tanacetum coccineum]
MNKYSQYIFDFHVLPNVFTETLYTGNPWLYLIHNRGTKHKVWIKKVTVTNNYAPLSNEWKAFISDSRYVMVNTLHFIRAAPDEYYVIGYHNDGCEGNGYDLARVGYQQRRCLVMVADMEESPILPGQFLPNIVNNQVRVMVSDALASSVTHRRVVKRLVFTNLLNNSVSMMPFADSGLGLQFERIPCMPLDHLVPFIRSPIDKGERRRDYMMSSGAEDDQTGEGGSMSHGYTYY